LADSNNNSRIKEAE